jgi:hypothetical protein
VKKLKLSKKFVASQVLFNEYSEAAAWVTGEEDATAEDDATDNGATTIDDDVAATEAAEVAGLEE